MTRDKPIRTLRVATWNIHACVGMDRRLDPDRILAVIDALDADLLALQEVPLLSEHPELRALLDSRARYRVLFNNILTDHAHGFGNALLSRLPIIGSHRIDLAWPGREPRDALGAQVEMTDGRRLQVLATHLGLKARERRWQYEQLARSLATSEGPALLMGDFNEWRVPPGKHLARSGVSVASQSGRRSFPAPMPMLSLDHILTTSDLQVLDVRAWRGPGLWLASDHLPLVADIALADENEAD